MRALLADLDLLVRQQDIRRATELMIAAGYWAGSPRIDAGKRRARNQQRSSIPCPANVSAGEQANPSRHRRASPGRHTPAPQALALYDQGADSL